MKYPKLETKIESWIPNVAKTSRTPRTSITTITGNFHFAERPMVLNRTSPLGSVLISGRKFNLLI